MKKTYEKPVLATEPFDVQDVITASSPAGDTRLADAHNNFPADVPLGGVTFN